MIDLYPKKIIMATLFHYAIKEIAHPFWQIFERKTSSLRQVIIKHNFGQNRSETRIQS